MEPLPNLLDTLPYKPSLYVESGLPPTHSTSSPDERKQLCLSATGRPASAGLTQRSECLVYTEEVGGSNPSARTIPLTKGQVALVDSEDFERFGHLKWTAGSFNGRVGYAHRSVWGEDGKCRTILLHRAILEAKLGQIVDHRNGNTFDCRRSNLRFASRAQNVFNARRKIAASGFRGVESQTPGRYRGHIALNWRSYYTKTYDSPIMAAIARDALALRLHGEFAVLNFQYIPVSSEAA